MTTAANIQSAPGMLSPTVISEAVDSWLREDIPSFDVGGAVVGSGPASAHFFVKSDLVLAGQPFAEAVLGRLGCHVRWLCPEGQWVRPSAAKHGLHAVAIPRSGATAVAMIVQRQSRAASAPAPKRRSSSPASSSRDSSPAPPVSQQPASAASVVAPSGRVLVGVASGPINRLLQAERTCLEALTRASACATYARRCVEFAQSANPTWPGRVAATRKTTPGAMRAIEKYGAICGGADPHRYSLSSMVMLKDNHIDACGGSIPAAVTRARALAGFSTKVEVECRSLDDAFAAAGAGAHVVMLDNFTPAAAHEAARAIKEKFPHVLVEASGGMRAETLGAYCSDYIDVISVGQITHGPPPCDISMKVAKAGAASQALMDGDDARVKRTGKL